MAEMSDDNSKTLTHIECAELMTSITNRISQGKFDQFIIHDIFLLFFNYFGNLEKVHISNKTIMTFLSNIQKEIEKTIKNNPDNNEYTNFMNDEDDLKYLVTNFEFYLSNNYQYAYILFILLPNIFHILSKFSDAQNYDTFMNLNKNVLTNITRTIINLFSNPRQIITFLKYKTTFNLILEQSIADNDVNFAKIKDDKLNILVNELIEVGMDDQLELLRQSFPNTPMDFISKDLTRTNTLQLACTYGCYKLVDYLLSLPSALVNASYKNSNQMNAVYFAATHSQRMLEKFMHFPDELFDIVHPHSKKTPLWFACYKNMASILPQIIQKTNRFNHGLLGDGFTPIMLCCRYGNLDATNALLTEGNSNVEYHSNLHGNALAEAALHTTSDILCETIIDNVMTSTINYVHHGSDPKPTVNPLYIYLNFIHVKTGNTILMNICKNRMRSSARKLFNTSNVYYHYINIYFMDTLSYCLLNDWKDEVMHITKNNMSQYLNFIRILNNQHIRDLQFTIYLIILIAISQPIMPEIARAIYAHGYILLDAIQNITPPETMTIPANMVAYSSVEGGDVNVATALNNGDIIFMYNDTAYAASVEFILNILQDPTKIKYACKRAITNLNTFNEHVDLFHDIHNKKFSFISMTLFGLPSGVINVLEIYLLLKQTVKITKLVERNKNLVYPAMMSEAYLSGTSSIGADHCQPDANGNPLYQIDYKLVPIEPIMKRNSEQDSAEMPSAKRATPTFIAKIKTNSYSLVSGQTSTLQELYDEIVAYGNGAPFRIIYSGHVIRSEELQANGGTLVSEFQRNGRPIFTGSEGMVLQILFSAAAATPASEAAPAAASIGGKKNRKKRTYKRNKQRRHRKSKHKRQKN